MSDQHKPRDGGPAFPAPYSAAPNGMTLRDWFAGMALQGILASGIADTSRLSSVCYIFADAMLVQRAQKAEPL